MILNKPYGNLKHSYQYFICILRQTFIPIIPAVLLGKICILIIVERHCSKIVLSNVELYIGIVWMIRLNYHPLSLVLLEN